MSRDTIHRWSPDPAGGRRGRDPGRPASPPSLVGDLPVPADRGLLRALMPCAEYRARSSVDRTTTATGPTGGLFF